MSKIWVKAAHPRASFYQEVLVPSETGGQAKLVIEHVHAPTVLRDGHPDHGLQIPVPMQVTDTSEVRRALIEKHPAPGNDQPARIVLCEDKEVAEYLKSIGKALEAEESAEPKKGKRQKAETAEGEG